jgi:transcriptional regulator with XRE-family HTH domain
MDNKFLQFMAAYGLSQYRMHKKTHFTKSQISEWMRGLHRPSRKSAYQIACTLGIPFESLLAQIEVRECYQNDISPTGEFVARQKKDRLATDGTNDANRTAVCCSTCKCLFDEKAA